MSFLKLPKDLIAKKGVKCLVYGGAGVGKTRNSAVTAPAPLFVSIENGMLSIANENIPVWDCRPQGKDPATSYGYTLNAFAQLLSELTKGSLNQYQTVIIDSWSELASIVLQSEMPKHKDGRMAYGAMAEIMLKWADILVQINQNVIFICKQEAVVNNNITYHQPALEGKKLYTEFTHKIDLILRFQPKRFVIQGKSAEYMVASVKNQPDYIARDRSGKLADDEPQDFNVIFSKIKS